MFVRTPPHQLDDDAIEHLLAEVFASVEDPEPADGASAIDAELTEADAQAILDGFELAMAQVTSAQHYRRHRSQNSAA